MGLRNLTFPTVEVQTSGGALAVRGLSLDHIMGIFYRHRAVVTDLFDTVVSKARAGQSSTPEDAIAIAIKMIDAVPDVVAEMIALAAGSDATDEENFAGDVGIARKLNIAEQIDALEKIGEQTFTSDMPPGKLLALVRKAMQAGTSALQTQP